MDARELVADHVHLVRRVARQFARRMPKGASVDDLLGAGTIGLISAAKRYREDMGAFAPFAEWRIKGAIRDELRSRDNLTREQRGYARDVAAARRALGQRLMRRPTAAEIAAELGWTADELEARWRAARVDRRSLPVHARISFTAADGAGALGDTWGDILPDEAAADPFEVAAENERRALVREAVAAMPERTQRIMALRFGDEMSLADIGRAFGVSESMVCLIVKRATADLRQRLAHLDEGARDAVDTPA